MSVPLRDGETERFSHAAKFGALAGQLLWTNGGGSGGDDRIVFWSGNTAKETPSRCITKYQLANKDGKAYLRLNATLPAPINATALTFEFTSPNAVADRERWLTELRRLLAPPAPASASAPMTDAVPATPLPALEPETPIPPAAAATPNRQRTPAPAAAAATSIRVKPEPGTTAAAPAAATATTAARTPVRTAAAAAAAPAASVASTARRPAARTATAAPAAAGTAIVSSSAPVDPLASLAAATGLSPSDLLAARAGVLARAPELKRLHTALVESGAITEAEFWETRQVALRNEANRADHQKRGVSTGAVPGAGAGAGAGQPKATAVNETKVIYQLDAQEMHSIFVQFPAVYSAYQANVPDKLSEVEFWTRYFEARNRAEAKEKKAAGAAASGAVRVGGGVKLESFAGVDDEHLFQAAKPTSLTAEEETNRKKPRLLVDPSVDLSSAELLPYIRAAELDERKGLKRATADEKAALIHKYNRFSQLIVAPVTAAQRPTNADESRHSRQYHTELAAASELPDLRADVAPAYNRLSITADSERLYFDASATNNPKPNQTPAAASAAAATAASDSSDRARAAQSFERGLTEWFAPPVLLTDNGLPLPVDANGASSGAGGGVAAERLNRLWSGANNLSILQSVSSATKGLARAQTAKFESADSQRILFSTAAGERDIVIPREFQTQLRDRVLYAHELLRHVWLCIPPTPATQPKLDRLRVQLDRLYTSLVEMRVVLSSQQPKLALTLKPLLACIDKVFDAAPENKASAAPMSMSMSAGSSTSARGGWTTTEWTPPPAPAPAAAAPTVKSAAAAAASATGALSPNGKKRRQDAIQID